MSGATEPLFHTFDVYSLTNASTISDQVERSVACETQTHAPDWDDLCGVTSLFLETLDVDTANYCAPYTRHLDQYWKVCEFWDAVHGQCIVRASAAPTRLFLIDIYDPATATDVAGPVLQTFRFNRANSGPFWNELVDFALRFCDYMSEFDARLTNEHTMMPPYTLVGADWIPFTIASEGAVWQVRCRRVGGTR